MNEFPRKNKTDAGTVFGALALILIGVPIILCLACGFGTWAMMGFPGGPGWMNGRTAAWQNVVNERKRMHGELVTEINNMAANPTQIPAGDLQRLTSRGYEVDRQVKELADAALRKYGPPPKELAAELKSTAELEQAMANLRTAQMNAAFSGNSSNSNSGQSFAERMAQQRADAEQRAAQYRAEAEQRENERRAREQQLAEQRAAAARAQEQAMRDRLASLGSPPTPQPFFNPGQPAAPQQPVEEAPPGFPCTNIGQVKPKDLVHVRYQDKWYPALVLLKRGINVTIRYTTNGNTEVVQIDRIRLQVESTDKAEGQPSAVATAPAVVAPPAVIPDIPRLPGAVRPTNPPKPVKTKDDEDAENLLVIKPGSDKPAATNEPATPVAPAPATKPAAPPVDNFRLWTDDTGTRSFEAELVAFEFDLVNLKRRDGSVVSLRIERFSPTDQAFIREKFK
jgi:hypothetical protein